MQDKCVGGHVHMCSHTCMKLHCYAWTVTFLPITLSCQYIFINTNVCETAFMEELGLGNADDISELSDGPSEINAVGAAAGAAIMAAAASAVPAASDSEWDSTVKSDHGPRQGILKKWNKVSDGSGGGVCVAVLVCG